MLPDFIKVKRELAGSHQAAFSRPNDPLISEIRTYINHEGDRFTQFREDGSKESLVYEKIAVKVEVNRSDIRKKGEVAVREAFASARTELTRQQQKLLLNRLSETSPKFDAGGRAVSAGLILEMLEQVEFSFDDHGNWIRPRELCGPAIAERLKAEYQRLETEPDLIRKMTDLLARKKKQWDVREANRKLVD